MKTITNIAWVYYVEEELAQKLDDNKVGKWMYFFNDRAFAERICREAVETGVVVEAKHSNAEEGVCCFYLNCDDMDAHKRVITFFLENRLIKRTKAGKLHNISFKLDKQTYSGEYGDRFHSEIKLINFVNLETGELIGDIR